MSPCLLFFLRFFGVFSSFFFKCKRAAQIEKRRGVKKGLRLTEDDAEVEGGERRALQTQRRRRRRRERGGGGGGGGGSDDGDRCASCFRSSTTRRRASL